jgi:hypothetical protein
MNVSTCPPVPHLPISILELICDELAADVSRLGRILAALRSEAAPSSHLGEVISATPVWVTPTFDGADYLPVPAITVEHKIFGPGLPLHRTLLDNDRSAVVVFYDRATTRTLLIDAAYWVTPIEVLMGVELQRVDEAKFEYIPPSVEADADNYCSPLEQFVVVEKERACFALRGYVTPNDGAECNYGYKLRGLELPLREIYPTFEVSHTQQRRAVTIATELARRANGWHIVSRRASVIEYSPDAFDQEIIRERKKRGAVELEAITKFDRALSR